MKKALLLLASAALLFASCQKEQIAQNDGEGIRNVTFTVGVAPAATKAVSDGDGAGTKVNHWIMEVRDSDGAVYSRQDENGTQGTLTHTFEVPLVKGQTYDMLFWADNITHKDEVDVKYYNTTDLTNVTLTNAATYEANLDERDAFSAVVKNFSTTQATQRKITLKRPLAQLNVQFTDLNKLYTTMGGNASEYVKFEPEDFAVKAKVPTSFNVFEQAAETVSEVTMTAAQDYKANYGNTPTAPKVTLFMDYIFASPNSKDIVDIDFSFVSNGVPIAHNFTSIPFQRNYRTNILGDFMSTGATWNVTVDPAWDSGAQGADDYNVVYYAASSIEAANTYIGTQNTEQTKTVDLTNAEIKSTDVKGDGTIHFLLKKTSPKDEVSFVLPPIPSNLAAAGCTGWTIEYEADYPTKNVNVTAPANTNVIILAPTSHVVLNGETYANITAYTGYGTLVVPKGVTVSDLKVTKGWVEIHGTVTTLQDIVPAACESVYFRDCEGLSQTVFAKIKGDDFSFIHPDYVEKQNGDNWDIIPVATPVTSVSLDLGEVELEVGADKSLASASNCTGFSSIHTTGRISSYGRLYTSRTTSIAATKAAL